MDSGIRGPLRVGTIWEDSLRTPFTVLPISTDSGPFMDCLNLKIRAQSTTTSLVIIFDRFLVSN